MNTKPMLALAAWLVLSPAAGNALTIGLDSATAFQDDGSTANSGIYGTVNVTAAVQNNDGGLSPLIMGGSSAGYLDGISLDFDWSQLAGLVITDATLTLDVVRGSYPSNSECYQLQYGAYNLIDNSNPKTDLWPGTGVVALPGTPIVSSFSVDPGLFSPNGELTLRLWNLQVDSISLSVEAYDPRPTAAVPEPATLLLLGAGFLGVGVLRRRKLF